MIIRPVRTRIFKEGERLLPFIKGSVKKIAEGSILVVTSKIVALAEGRAREIEGPETREKLIKEESQWAMRTKYTWLTIKDNTVMSSAGVDESNADGKIILLPKDAWASADRLRRGLGKFYKVKNFGVLITDSRLLPFRGGITGVAVGYSGFSGLRDYRGTPDIFGRILKLSRTDVADSLAAAAVLTMGEGAEQQPLAVVTGAPVRFVKQTRRKELEIDLREDLYQPLFERIRKIKWET